jgi:hypothetical protein
MDGMRFDRLVRELATPGTRRGLLSGLGAVPLLGLSGGEITPEGEAAGRQHRKAKRPAEHHHLQQESKRKKCAKAGQKPKRGKRCCPGLVDDGAGRCRASQDVPTPPDDAGGSTCQSCGGATPICEGGACVACTADAQCAAAGLGARCCHGRCQACCETADCPSPQCQSCQNGTCVAANGGQICGMSTTSGGATRCCNGSCPDLVCVPVGASGPSCNPGDSCNGVNCCSGHPSTCVVDQCFCPQSFPGESCGSDADCAGNTSAKACICGTCQVPPP